MKYTLWDQKYSGRDEVSQDTLLNLFDPSGSLDMTELLEVLELVARTSEISLKKLRPTDRFDEIFRRAPTKNIFRWWRMETKLFDLDTTLEVALRKKCKKSNLPIPKTTIMTLEEYMAAWFGAQSKAS